MDKKYLKLKIKEEKKKAKIKKQEKQIEELKEELLTVELENDRLHNKLEDAEKRYNEAKSELARFKMQVQLMGFDVNATPKKSK